MGFALVGVMEEIVVYIDVYVFSTIMFAHYSRLWMLESLLFVLELRIFRRLDFVLDHSFIGW